MDTPVNLTNLRSMTDGDAEMEKALFEEFFSAFENGINHLQDSYSGDAAETWRKETHALKGIALNLGAARLGGLCKDGQDGYLGDAQAKESILHNVREEYARVKQFLQELR